MGASAALDADRISTRVMARLRAEPVRRPWARAAVVATLLAIELLAGAQAVEFLAPLQPGAGVRAAREFVRSLSPRLRDDRPLAPDIEVVATAIGDGSLVEAVESEVGELR